MHKHEQARTAIGESPTRFGGLGMVALRTGTWSRNLLLPVSWNFESLSNASIEPVESLLLSDELVGVDDVPCPKFPSTGGDGLSDEDFPGSM